MTPERLAFSTRITKYTKKELISLAVEQYDRICEMEIREKRIPGSIQRLTFPTKNSRAN